MIVTTRFNGKRLWIPERIIEQITESDYGSTVLVVDKDDYTGINVVEKFDSLMEQLTAEKRHDGQTDI